MTAGNSIGNLPPPAHAQSFYHFGKGMLFTECDLHDGLNRCKAMDGAEPVSFVDFLNFTLENTATALSQGRMALQQYLNAMRIFRYDTNKRMQVWKGKDDGHFERAL